MEDGEVPIINVSDRKWNDDSIAATLNLTLPPEVSYYTVFLQSFFTFVEEI